MGTMSRVRGWCAAAAALATLATAAPALSALPAGAATTAPPSGLYLVTLKGPGVAGHRGPAADRAVRRALVARQDRVLARVDAGEPTYRWTTALDGVAVALDRAQATALLDDPRVQMVEADSVRRLAGHASPGKAGPSTTAASGGAGQVVGVVDSGIWRQSPLFAPVGPHAGPRAGFRHACRGGEGWSRDDCNAKLVAARWFVDGFGTDHLRSGTPLSASDDSGHGTAVASIAVGDAGVSVAVPGQRRTPFAGVAPRARLAVYKACWTAPDPDDDGCSAADLVTAVDRATRDGVDVLALAVAGPPRVDTLELALLGAAEADVVVVAAAGNDGSRAYAAHPVPWVTTVGASVSSVRRGVARAGGGPSWTGTMTARRGVARARVVLGRDVAAHDASVRDARFCVPGSLDVARTAGTVVVCDRGLIGRIAKSEAVRAADGAGMVLVNTRPGAPTEDLHAVPTVHLTQHAGRALERWVARHPHARLSLRPAGTADRARPVPWSSPGDPAGGLVKPDVLGAGVGVLAASPPTAPGGRWTLLSGTSAATALVAGTAAALRSRHPWSAARTRSVLAATAAPVRGGVLRQGSGLVAGASRPGLVLDQSPAAYRAWLRDPGHRLNSPSVMVRAGAAAHTHRTLTNVSGHEGYWSSTARGFAGHDVSVTPAAVRLRPGQRARFTVHVSGDDPAVDDGWVVWRGADGSVLRVPVVVSR